jgi:hypothetical protein
MGTELQTRRFIHGDSYEKWIKETSVDIRTGPRAENAGAQENSGRQNCQEVETDGRSNAPESVQSWIVARFALTNRRVEFFQLRSPPRGAYCPSGRCHRGPPNSSLLVFSECPLFFATLLTRVRHSNLPLSGCDAIKRATLCALALDTRLALRNGDGFALHRLFHQPFGLLALLVLTFREVVARRARA